MKDAPPTAISELRQWPRWVVWRTVERDGKPTKVPLQPNGKPAKSTDPDTWATYEQAAAALERGRYDGIGYVFAPDDEYTGVDLDKCVEPASDPFTRALGPTVCEPARRFVNELDSYTELSPTGTGLHVIVRGRINGSRNRTGKTPWGGEFEYYDQARFFTITGEHLAGTPTEIMARQEVLDALAAELFPPSDAKRNGAGVRRDAASARDTGSTLDDVELEEKIRASKQGPKFAELFDRGAPEGKESESDLGLCNILAFWLGPDESRIDAWFRRSALMRDKWDDKRGATTYGGYTIDRALDGRTEFYGQKTTRPRLKHDDPGSSYADEITGLFGLIDDPIVHGWRSSRKATARVVFTTRSGAVLDLDSWKAATGQGSTLAQEIGVQLGVETKIKAEEVRRLNVLVSKFCELRAAMTVQDRAYELGLLFLQQAEALAVDLKDTADRWAAFKRLHECEPTIRSKVENIPLGAACIVLHDVSGKRYVPVQWFVDYVKANAVAGTGAAILDHITEPGGWDRIQNKKGQMKATNPVTKECIWKVLYEVPPKWGESE